MKTIVALASIAGVFGLLADANAQTAPSTTAAPQFDGTYRLVSSTRANEMYTSYNGQTAACPYRKPGPLHIQGGLVHYRTATGYRLGGKIGPQGELAMRSEMVGGSRPARLQASGTIDANGVVHVHQMGSSCSYDFVWQKRS